MVIRIFKMIDTSGFLTVLECAPNPFSAGARPRNPLGRSPSWFKGHKGRGGTGERGRKRERNGPPLLLSQIPGSAPVDVAVYTAMVLATDCNISLRPARLFLLPNIIDGNEQNSGSGNLT